MMHETWLLLDSRGLGGIETHVAELAAGLAAAGAAPRVLFLADYGPHPLHGRLSQDAVPWEVVRGGVAGLRRMLRARRPRVLHTHGYKANIVGRLAAFGTAVKAVATYHAGERPAGRLAVYDVLDRYSSGLGPRIAVSRPILARLPFGGALVPNFVRVPDLPPVAGPRCIGFAGRLAHEKAPDRFAAIAAALPDLPFLAFGDGPMRAALEQSAPANLTCRGAVAGMDAHWREIGLLLIPSRGEGMPLAALEAMAHGVPVAAFALGGLPELIEDGRTGYLAPPDDVPALTDCVRAWRALDGCGRDAMANAAWQAVATRFGREAGVAAIEAIYQAA